jgi:clan AA aspartic protease
MISGVVTSNREATIRVLVRGARGQEAEVEAVIDTGFTGFLTLPARLIANLVLSFTGTTRAALADGSEVAMDVFEASVLWDDLERDVVVLAAEGVALVGMALLSGYRVTLEVEGGGSVRIEALSGAAG